MLFLNLLKTDCGVIVSRRNSGFGDNLIGAANAWRYAKETGRRLVILWAPSRYLADRWENAFNRFFDVPKAIEGVPIMVPERVDAASHYLLSLHYALFPSPDPKLLMAGVLKMLGLNGGPGFANAMIERQSAAAGIINRREDVKSRILITHGCYDPSETLRPFFDSLGPAPRLQKTADGFAAANFAGRKVIGVHVRYYGRYLPVSGHTEHWKGHAAALSRCLTLIHEARARLGSEDCVIFLSTDSGAVEEFLAGAVDDLVTYRKPFGRDPGRELHEELPVETAEATIIEMFLLARSDILVRFPPGSWFSHYASLYAKEVIV